MGYILNGSMPLLLGYMTVNSALKRKLRKQHRDTVIANVLGFAILAMTVAAIYVINYQIILIRYGN